jgi:YHS domain-containing protein
MEFLGRMIRYIFWALIAWWTLAILRRIVNGFGQGIEQASNTPGETDLQMPTQQQVSRRLVRDPECGMHLTESLALPLRQGGELLHFCSAECRDRFLGKSHKLAANA